MKHFQEWLSFLDGVQRSGINLGRHHPFLISAGFLVLCLGWSGMARADGRED
jgi:hypothetical protein